MLGERKKCSLVRLLLFWAVALPLSKLILDTGNVWAMKLFLGRQKLKQGIHPTDQSYAAHVKAGALQLPVGKKGGPGYNTPFLLKFWRRKKCSCPGGYAIMTFLRSSSSHSIQNASSCSFRSIVCKQTQANSGSHVFDPQQVTRLHQKRNVQIY